MIMGMPIIIEIVDSGVSREVFEKVFTYFKYIDNKFSTFKKNSEISLINQGKLDKKNYSSDMKKVFKLSAETKKQTAGFFDINNGKIIDPSGLVKGWAIYNGGKILKKQGIKNFYISAGGDIEVSGKNNMGEKWAIGIRNPFNVNEIIKVLKVSSGGVATSGIYERGEHVYNPHLELKTKEGISSSAYNPKTKNKVSEIVSLTVVGPNIYEADRFATAAFAMGKTGINFIENLKGLEGYMIDQNGLATFTNGFKRYTIN